MYFASLYVKVCTYRLVIEKLCSWIFFLEGMQVFKFCCKKYNYLIILNVIYAIILIKLYKKYRILKQLYKDWRKFQSRNSLYHCGFK